MSGIEIVFVMVAILAILWDSSLVHWEVHKIKCEQRRLRDRMDIYEHLRQEEENGNTHK